MLPEQTADDLKLGEVAVEKKPLPPAVEQVTITERFDISKSSNVREFIRNFDHYVKSHPNYGNISEHERADLDNRIQSYEGLMAQESPGDSDLTLPQLLRVYKLLWAGQEQSEGGAATGVDLLKCNNSNDLIDMLYSLVTQHQKFAQVDDGGKNGIKSIYDDYSMTEGPRNVYTGIVLGILLGLYFKLSSL